MLIPYKFKVNVSSSNTSEDAYILAKTAEIISVRTRESRLDTPVFNINYVKTREKREKKNQSKYMYKQ